MKNIIQEYLGKKEVKSQQSPFTVDTSFENTLFMATPIIGEDMIVFDKSYVWSLNHWVVRLMQITVQTRYVLQYITMRLSVYMNAPTEPEFIAIKNGMEYIMNYLHETIIYSRKKIYKTDEIPHQCYFK